MTVGIEFDEYALRDLVRSFVASDVRHLTLDTGQLRVEIEKAAPPLVAADPPPSASGPHDAPAQDRVADAPRPTPAATVAVTAPSVGIFRWTGSGRGRPEPGVDVDDGEQLAVVAVRANEVSVPSPGRGRVVEVLVEDGAFVEYGEVLAHVDVSPS